MPINEQNVKVMSLNKSSTSFRRRYMRSSIKARKPSFAERHKFIYSLFCTWDCSPWYLVFKVKKRYLHFYCIYLLRICLLLLLLLFFLFPTTTTTKMYRNILATLFWIRLLIYLSRFALWWTQFFSLSIITTWIKHFQMFSPLEIWFVYDFLLIFKVYKFIS